MNFRETREIIVYSWNIINAYSLISHEWWISLIKFMMKFAIHIREWSRYLWYLGSVWIGLILLKLKTYCWNHCSKIIFKCVNSTVGPIFNEKIDKKWNLWVHEQCTNALFTGKSQQLWLLFMQQCINSNRIPSKTREKKKKKKKKAKRRCAIQTIP